MAVFARPEKQAASVMRKLIREHIQLDGKAWDFNKCYVQVTAYIKERRMGGLRDITPAGALEYLEHRALVVDQATLDIERKALQTMMRYVTHKLDEHEVLGRVQARLPAPALFPSGK